MKMKCSKVFFKPYQFFGIALMVTILIFSLTFKVQAEKTLNVITPTGGLASGLGAATTMFENQFGVKVTVSAAPWESMHEKLMAEFFAKVGQFDVIALHHSWRGFSARFLEELTPYIKRSGLKMDEFLGRTPLMAHWQDRQVGLPVRWGSLSSLYYRKDLFEKAGVTPPVTSADFMRASKALTNPAQKVYGTNLLLGGGPPTVEEFFVWLVRKNGQILVSDGRGINSYESEHGRIVANLLADWKNLYDNGWIPKDSMTWSVWEGMTNFVKGRVAMTNMYSARVGLVENPEKSDVAGKVGYVITPGVEGAPLTGGGWSLTIPNYISQEKKELAFEYIKFLTSREIQLMMALEHANGPTRGDVLLSTEYRKLFPADAIDIVAKSAEKLYIPPETSVPQFPEIGTAISDTARAVVTGKRTPEEGSRKIFTDVRRIMGLF